MSQSVISVTKFIGTDAFRANPEVAGPALALIGNAPGSSTPLTGVVIQDPQYGYVVNVWESVKHHEELLANKTADDQIRQAFGPVLKMPAYRAHVKLSVDPTPALASPVTEIARWILHSGASREEFTQKLTQFIDYLLAIPASGGIFGGGWGPVLEDEKQFIVILGWESVEVFNDVVQKSEVAKQLLLQLKSLANLELEHVALRSFV